VGDVGSFLRRTCHVASSLVVAQFPLIFGNIRLVVVDVADILVPVDAVMIQIPVVLPQVAMILVKIPPILIHIALPRGKQCGRDYKHAHPKTSSHIFFPVD
jgi:hypothetical protein